MKTTKLIIFLILTLSFSNMNAQTIKEKDQQRQENKVKLFSDEEFANFHVWFYNEVQKMELSEKADNDYLSILNMHLSSMSRLDDKDKNYSNEEIIEKFNEIMKKLDDDVKPVLNEKQYEQHLEIMEVVLSSHH